MVEAVDQYRYEEAKEVYANAECLISATEIERAYDQMADDITRDLARANPILMCVMMGGMQATVELGKRLTFPFELDYLHATRYRGRTTGGGLIWKANPGLSIINRHVLIVDDILDEGHTLAAIIQSLEAQGVASVHTAMLLKKDHGRCVPDLHADYIGARVPDRFVFGAGMDYKGYFRQLTGVWARAE